MALVAAMFAVGVFFLVSCEKENEKTLNQAITSVKLQSPLNIKETNAIIDEYARIIRTSMNDAEFRKILKEEVLKRFDGDYDVLVLNLHSKRINSINITVGERLASIYNDFENKKFNMSGSDFINYVGTVIPNLQIAIPELCEKWDDLSEVLDVIPLPIDFCDTNSTIYAYSEDLKLKPVPVHIKPTVPFAIVGISERINDKGVRIKDIESDEQIVPYVFPQIEMITGLSYPASLSVMQGYANELDLEWSDVEDESGYVIFRKHLSGDYEQLAEVGTNVNGYVDQNLIGGDKYSYYVCSKDAQGVLSAASPKKSTFASNRRDGQPLVIKRMRYSEEALDRVESWLRGAPEIRITVAHGTASATNAIKIHNSVYEPDRRKDICDKWWYHDIVIASNWYIDTYGTCLAIYITEDDNINLTSFQLTANYEDKLMTENDSSNSTSNSGPGTIKFGGTLNFTSNDGTGHTDIFYWDASSRVFNINDCEFYIQ